MRSCLHRLTHMTDHLWFHLEALRSLTFCCDRTMQGQVPAVNISRNGQTLLLSAIIRSFFKPRVHVVLVLVKLTTLR
jgi:hypothetical protein